MNEETTKDLHDKKSFEERVLTRLEKIDKRFDGIYARFDIIEVRLQKLESHSYDTKPIWARAMTEISETRSEVAALAPKVAAIATKVDGLDERVGNLEGEVAGIRSDYGKLHNELIDSQRDFKGKITRRFDMVLELLVEMRNAWRDSDERLNRLESKLA